MPGPIVRTRYSCLECDERKTFNLCCNGPWPRQQTGLQEPSCKCRSLASQCQLLRGIDTSCIVTSSIRMQLVASCCLHAGKQHDERVFPLCMYIAYISMESRVLWVQLVGCHVHMTAPKARELGDHADLTDGLVGGHFAASRFCSDWDSPISSHLFCGMG